MTVRDTYNFNAVWTKICEDYDQNFEIDMKFSSFV
jgi:hypothetical protein